MKSNRLFLAATFIVATIASTPAAMAQRGDNDILFIGSTESEDGIILFDNPDHAKRFIKKECDSKKAAKEEAALIFAELIPTGYQSAQPPLAIFTQKNNKFAFALGGFIQLRTSYDFNGTVENIDFIPADIPITSDYSNKQQLMMDASTSRLYFMGHAQTRALGDITVHIDADFRGGTGYNAEGITNSYTPRIRTAYVSFLGFTIGRDVTTFCDLDSAPETIDFEGPNAYSFNFATMLRYQHTFCNERWTAAIALEQPDVSATYGTNFEAIPQRVPDVPMYLQYRIGAKQQHHLRASAVLRDMYLYNKVTNDNISLLGWGVQLSGNIEACEWLNFCFNGTYGKGITPYIQDLNDLGYDFTPDPADSTTAQAPEMYGWQAAAKLMVTRRVSLSGGYSTVRIRKDQGFFALNEYRVGQYIFGNMFYHVTPRFQVACEYLYGTRKDMNCLSNHANRASVMGQFFF